jgi:hypothetical protein
LLFKLQPFASNATLHYTVPLSLNAHFAAVAVL